MSGLLLLLPALLCGAAGERPYPGHLHAAPHAAGSTGHLHSAASAGQLRFALENKYDDTGPGAKGPTHAYAAYKSLDDALLAYLNDPDTKLPDAEKERVIQKISQGFDMPETPYQTSVIRFHPKRVEEYTGYKKPEDKATLLLTKISPKKHYQPLPFVFQGSHLKKLQGAEPYKVSKIHHGSNPVSVAHYSRGSTNHIYSHPNYQFTFDVHVPETRRGEDQSRAKLEEQLSVPSYPFVDQSGAQPSLQYGPDQLMITRPDVTRPTHLDRPPHLGQVRPPHLSDQISLLESQRYLQYSEHLLRAKEDQENLQHNNHQKFLGAIVHGDQRRPVTYGDQLFESRIEQGNPQYLEKRQTQQNTKPTI